MTHWRTPHTDEPEIRATIRGNCGREHTFEEWQRCRSCDAPQPIKPWWRAVQTTPHTDEEGRRFYELQQDMQTISREVMIAIIMGCVGWIIGFGMGMVLG